MHQTLEQAVQFLTSTITTPPTQEAVVEALLQVEKQLGVKGVKPLSKITPAMVSGSCWEPGD